MWRLTEVKTTEKQPLDFNLLKTNNLNNELRIPGKADHTGASSTTQRRENKVPENINVSEK